MTGSNNVFIRKIFSFYLFLSSRARYIITLDFLMLCLSVYIAYSLRLTFFIKQGYIDHFLINMIAFSFCILASLILGGTYKIVWTRASIEEYTSLLKWYAVGSLFYLSLLYFLPGIPRSSLVLMLLLGITFITGERALWKLIFVSRRVDCLKSKRALIIGAGEAGTLIARDITRNPSEIELIGFIDDNPNLKGMTVASVKVLGTTSALRKIIISEEIELVLIAMPSVTGSAIKEIVKKLDGLMVDVRILPSMIEIADGNVGISRLRSVQLEDLLRREPVKLDSTGIEKIIKGKRVLVTGAGGSIGSEIFRQILSNKPAELLALGHGEQSIYKLMESINAHPFKNIVRPIIADVADRQTINALFEKYRPEVVFHAAAHKHVPLMEDNPREALRVNSFGSYNLADIAGSHGSELFVMISTDKAVNPTIIMGATKRIAEKLIFSLLTKYTNTKYMVVRFGNVLGSRGSVIPKFEQQIKNGEPVTVTHKDMERYFMLIPEAVSLVLQSGALGEGGELFVLDMGEPVKITEMAETLIRLHGYKPYKDIDIVFTGIRPGEKLYEELFYDPNHIDKTTHDKIFQSKNTETNGDLLPGVERVLADSAEGILSEVELKAEIFQLSFNGL
ncbi:MAG: polysaccharide biosynthesis protein [Synergistaceae bacterium]|nr:polysaccharide biosynthesis protein [Synergistaceae bacterium]